MKKKQLELSSETISKFLQEVFVSFKQGSQDTQTIDGLMIQVVFLSSVRTAGSDRVRHHIYMHPVVKIHIILNT